MSRTLDTQLAMDALSMAIAHRGPPVTLHSDQGSTYATGSYREIVNRYDIRQSMGHKGDCWDNAPMESFFHTLKTELVMHCDYKTRDDARASLFGRASQLVRLHESVLQPAATALIDQLPGSAALRGDEIAN